MQQTPEIESFLSRIDALPGGPGVSLDAALQPSLDDEVALRKLFASDRQNPRLVNPHVGLIDVFDASAAIRTTRARVVEKKEDLNAKYVMPLTQENRRSEGAPAIVANLEEFKQNWSIFTEGSLSQLIDWNNVVAAGGSVLACLTPLDEEAKVSKRAIRKYYHSNAYPTSDVDLFLWGMNAEQAEAKIKAIYEAVRDSVPWDVTCIRTKHTVSIHSQYPYRSVQIVLRLYQSPAEILAGFDIDAPSCAYDGQRVWANPRAVVAMMRQCNTVDMTRRSPSYEIRLAKYSQRGFEVYVPTLKRDEIDPTIFERAISRMEGLARLLVLEKLSTDTMRTAFLARRRNLRGRPNTTTSYYRRHARTYKGDLKAETGIGIEMNDYDVTSLHIPYGPGWDARKIDKLVYQTDLGMNSTFNPKNKGRRLHRHPAFFGTIDECLEDCCENCPQPIDDDEAKLKQEEDESYICGRIKFIEENPGRQTMTGSFNPIDVGEWSEQVYIKPTQLLFTAIAANDRATVQKLLGEGIDVNQRDYVGRTTLHVAILSKAVDIAHDLIDAGARITARLADGRAPLHLAAQYDQPLVIEKLFERNAKNIAEAEKKKAEEAEAEKMDTKKDADRPSSEDDWSSHDDEDVVMSDNDDDADDEDEDGKKPPKKADDTAASQDTNAESSEIPEEQDNQPDIIEIDALDWDFGFGAIAYAVLYASITTLDALVKAGADPRAPTKQTDLSPPLHPLTLTVLRQDEDEACKIAERLLQLPKVTSSTADPELRTIFHVAVKAGRTKLVETLLRCDPHASAVLDFPAVQGRNVVFPVITAIDKKDLGVLGIMLAHGAKLELAEEDVTNALTAASTEAVRQVSAYNQVKNYLNVSYQPLEVAIRSGDDIAQVLVALGATIDFGLKQVLGPYSNIKDRRTLRDWADYAVNSIAIEIERKKAQNQLTTNELPRATNLEEKMNVVKTGWKAFHQQYIDSLRQTPNLSEEVQERAKIQQARRQRDELERLADVQEFLVEIQSTLVAHNAKTWPEVYPSVQTEAISFKNIIQPSILPVQKPIKPEESRGYVYLSNNYRQQNVGQHLTEQYDDLYEACYAGDNDRIQKLCLPIDGQDAPPVPGVPRPLNISVKMFDNLNHQMAGSGYTPLFVAISARKWSTAKLILAIATAQYEPENEADEIEFNIDMDSDDDDDDDAGSNASDITIERPEITFIDIATRPSAVKSEVHPRKMFSERVNWAKPNPSSVSAPRAGLANLLEKTVIDQDLDAFVHIANLYRSLPQPERLDASILGLTIVHDQPDILDEYIRRTGAGVDVAGARKVAGMKDGEGELPEVMNDSNRVYLGLNVQGKKRADLARKNDPNSQVQVETRETPLVWQAVLGKAKGIIKYLSSDRPTLGYKFYASTHSDPKAIWLKRMQESSGRPGQLLPFEKQLPTWLGWNITPLGESPLTAAILSDDVDIVKLIAKLEPNLIAQAVQTSIKFVNVNILMLAIRRQCNVKIMDYLLSRKVSATERGQNDGWNVYHNICELNSATLLEYFLQKLPKDVNDLLLGQQSKGNLNTPLHIAVKKGAKRLVSLLLEYGQSSLLVRDIDGQIPLYCAVKSGWEDITKQLLAASPLEAIYTENCVGDSALDSAARLELRSRLSTNRHGHNYFCQELSPSSHDLSGNPADVFVHNEEKITHMLESVNASQGRYKAKVVAAITKWAEERAPKLSLLKERQAFRKKRQEEEWEEERKYQQHAIVMLASTTDRSDSAAVWALVRDAVKSNSAETVAGRRLIHLFEVQQSVAASLAHVRGETPGEEAYGNTYSRYRSRRSRRDRYKDQTELEEEEDEEQKERSMSMVFRYLRSGADTL